MEPSDVIENRTYDEIALGVSVSLSRPQSKDDIALFAVMSGDVNSTHLDESYAIGSGSRCQSILTSRADNLQTRLASAAVAVLLAHARRQAVVPSIVAAE
jgi:hypothetical protein